MPPSVDSPVQTRLAFPVPDGVLGSGRNGPGGLCTRPVGRRHIFVQTDTGSVLGIELDRADNVQTVKKKMQTMLNVPTEQTALVFGDTVLKSDLSELRNDTPLRLTRALQRSLSTPCISPSSDVQVPADGGQPFEVVGGLRCCSKMKGIIKEIVKAIECGVEPIAVTGGLGGAYYFRNTRGESVAIVKPTDEEPFAPNNPKGFVGKSLGQPGLKRAVRVGETGVREVAAYLLDHEDFAKVPPTVLVKVCHHAFHINSDTLVHKGPDKGCLPVAKIASCQQFVHHDFDASDHGTSRFSVSAVHRIGILDIRIFNTDRHAGNILVRNVKPLDSQGAWGCSNVLVNEVLELIPIDHGLCLPEALEDPYFEWLHWPQSSLPFSEEEIDYIQRLDEYKDAEMLRRELPMLREACSRMLILSTIVLKRAAAAGFCLAEIGEMMSRDGIEEASHLELLCLQARLQVERELSAEKLCDDDDAFSEYSLGEDLHEQFEFEMDQEDDSKFSATADEDQLLSRSDHLNLSPFRYTFVSTPIASSTNSVFSNSSVPLSSATTPGGNYWLSSVSHPAAPITPQASRIPLLVLREASSSMEEEDEMTLPACNISAARPSFWNSRSAAPQAMPFGGKLEIRSPKSTRGERSPRVRPEFCPLVEEEEVNVFAETNLKTCMASFKIDSASPRAMSYRSVSFSNRKQRYMDYPERKAPASETTGKVNVNGGSPPLSLGDMNEDEWNHFMDYFEKLLQEAIVTKCNQKVSYRQRLGISCQF